MLSIPVIFRGMRPLVHPSIEDVTVEGILHALSDPVRVALFREIASSSCARNCTDFLAASERSIPKSTLSQHFKILRDAGLVRSERQGVQMQNTSRCTEVDGRFPGLLAAILNAHRVQTQARTSGKPRRARK